MHNAVLIGDSSHSRAAIARPGVMYMTNYSAIPTRSTAAAVFALALPLLFGASGVRADARPDGTLATITVCAVGCDYQLIVDAVDAAGVGDTVFVGEGVYEENIVIRRSIRVRGLDRTKTIVDAGGATGLWVVAGAGAVVSDMTIRAGGGRAGGGVLNAGALTLRRVDVTGSGDASGETFGGGIYNIGGSLTLSQSSVTDSVAEWGGAIFNVGSVVVDGSRLERNRARQGGGAVFNHEGVVLINNSIIAENRIVGVGSGGAIWNSDTAAVSNSAVYRNQASEFGGGIFQIGGGSYVTNSTFSANSGEYGGGGVYAVIGETIITSSTFIANAGLTGAALSNNGGSLFLKNTILADSPGSNCFGEIESLGYNIDSGNSCDFEEDGDLINTSPAVMPLGDNGGFTPTHALSDGSPAIDAGDLAGCIDYNFYELLTDQRGFARSVDGDGDLIDACDIGAFEYAPDDGGGPTPTPPPATVPGDVSVCPSGCDHVTIQAGIDAASAGQTVGIGSGTYGESIRISRPVTLRGAGVLNTAIESPDGAPSIEIPDGVGVTLESFGLSGGEGIWAGNGSLTLRRLDVSFTSGGDSGAVRSTGELLVEDSSITSNVSLGAGGGIHSQAGRLTVRRGTIAGNSSAGNGGGILAEGESLTLDDARISGNEGQNGGGVAVTGAVTIRDGTISANRGEFGGGILTGDGAIDIEGTTITLNEADLGAAMYTRGGGVVRDVRIVANNAVGEFGYGGGIFADREELEIVGGEITGNSSIAGGALYARAVVSLSTVSLTENTAWYGGALFATTAGSILASDLLVERNVAQIGGGGAYVDSGELTLDAVQVQGNSSERIGGGLLARGSATLRLEATDVLTNTAETGGGIAALENDGLAPNVVIENSTISDNEAYGHEPDEEDEDVMGYGGGIYGDGATIALRRSTVSGNDGVKGGGVASTGSIVMENATVSDNAAIDGGGGMWLEGSAALAHLTVSGNVADPEALGGAAVYISGTMPVEVSGTIFAPGLGAPNCAVGGGRLSSKGYNIDADGSCGLAGEGDLSEVDPLLDPLGWNGGRTRTHALAEDSPALDAVATGNCLDAGSAPLDHDQRGGPRPVDGDGDGSAACDIGSFEFDPSFSPPPTSTPSPTRTPGPGETPTPGDEAIIYLPSTSR